MRRLPILFAALAALGLSACDLHLRSRRSPALPAAPPPRSAAPSPDEAEAAEWTRIESTSASLVQTFQFGGALRFLDGEARIRPDRKERLEQMKEAVLVAARTEYGAIDREAKAALARDDFRGAVAIWERASGFDIQDLVQESRRQILEAQALASRRRHDDALPLLGPILAELSGLLKSRRDREALALLDGTLAAHPELRHELDWLRGTVMEAPGIFQCVERGIGDLRDQPFTLGGETVKLAGAKDGVATFVRDSADPLAVALGELPPDIFLKTALRGGARADYVGRFFLFTGHIAEGRAAWKTSDLHEALDAIADRIEEALAGKKK